MSKLQRFLANAQEHLDLDEQPHQTVLGVYTRKSVIGTTKGYWGIFIATNKRVIVYVKRLFGHDIETVPYQNISSIETGSTLMGGYVNVFAPGNEVKMKWIKDGDLRAFVDEVKTRQAQANARPPVDQPTGPIAELERLAKLRDSGAISTAEFQAKKGELLARV